MKMQILDASKIVLVTFICSALIMEFMKKIAVHVGAMDVPRSEEGNRHIHKVATPKLGAVGIFLAFLIGYMLFGEQSIRMNSILIGSFIMILTGVIDDIAPIKARNKLIGHIIAASIIVFYGGILLDKISAFGYTINFGWFAYPLTILFIIACSNIINLIDGLDGLSSGICCIFYMTIAVIGFFQGRYGSLVMVLTLIMLGSTLGFLLHNFNPAKIFAGDCATFMGYIIAIITLLEFKGPALISFFVPISILSIPILDTLFAIIRRLLRGQPPFKADKEHIHHQLLGMNFSQRTTVLIIYGINLLFAAASIFYTLKDPIKGQIIYIIIFLLVIWLVFHTSIISDKSKEVPKAIKKSLHLNPEKPLISNIIPNKKQSVTSKKENDIKKETKPENTKKKVNETSKKKTKKSTK